MKKMINKSHVEGILYESTLEAKVAGDTAKNPGMQYVNGKISVMVDTDNIISVDIYEGALTSKGAQNSKFKTAMELVSAPTVVKNGADAAIKVRIDSALSLNDWYRPDGELISSLRNFGGFIHIVSDNINPSATFDVDMLITSTTDEMQKNEDGDMEPTGALVLNGIIFDFANKAMPVKFVVENAGGVKYFQDLDQNTFTKVWGNMLTQTTTTTKTEESAFGDDKTVEYTNTRRKFVVTGTNKEPYAFGDEGVLTVAEVQEALAAREVMLASLKASTEARAKTSGAATTGAAPVAKGAAGVTFNF
jgi:hypothetical protein